VRAPVLASLWSSGPAAPHVRREFGSELLRCTYDRVTHFVHQVSQGAAASAFSPAASTLLARLNPNTRRGAAFGSYGFYKSLGYTAGPLLGGALVAAGGLRLLFITLTTLALAVAGWAATTVPAPPPLPRTRQTVLDLAHRLIEPTFLTPTAALAAATAALAVGVGYLPVSGRLDGLGPLATGAAVSVLALTAAITQPKPVAPSTLTASVPIWAWVLASPLPRSAWPQRPSPVSPDCCSPLSSSAPAPASSPHSPSPPSPSTPTPNDSAKPWAPPNSAANSATPAAPSSSAPSPPPPPSPPATPLSP